MALGVARKGLGQTSLGPGPHSPRPSRSRATTRTHCNSGGPWPGHGERTPRQVSRRRWSLWQCGRGWYFGDVSFSQLAMLASKYLTWIGVTIPNSQVRGLDTFRARPNVTTRQGNRVSPGEGEALTCVCSPGALPTFHTQPASGGFLSHSQRLRHPFRGRVGGTRHFRILLGLPLRPNKSSFSFRELHSNPFEK